MSRRERRAALAKARPSMGGWEPLEPVVVDLSPLARIGNVRSCWRNNRYAVEIFDRYTDWGEVMHLAIRRHDGTPVRAWSDLQRIKNQLAGEDRVAIEVFPKATHVVDLAPMTHLWVLPTTHEPPFTIAGRWV